MSLLIRGRHIFTCRKSTFLYLLEVDMSLFSEVDISLLSEVDMSFLVGSRHFFIC